MQQKEMEAIIPSGSADENNARLDRIFDRLYKLRGSDLRGLADEIEDEETDTHQNTSGEYQRRATGHLPQPWSG